MKTIKLATIFLLLAQALVAQVSNLSMMHNGLQRNYTLYVPANYTGSAAVPLVFSFHGFGGSGPNQLQTSNFNAIADTAGFIVVYPTGSPLAPLNINHWNVGGWTNASSVDDIDFTSTLLDTLAAQYNINLARVYACGFSNGGFFSHRLACELGNRIAAIASVSGTFTPQMQTNCAPSHATPVMEIHGTTDAVVPYNGTTGNGGMASVDTVIRYWVISSGSSIVPTITPLPDINTADGSTVEHYVYASTNNAPVELLKITNGGHDWPGNSGNMDINASLEIWKFFSRFSNSAVAVQEVKNSTAAITLYPNPTSGQINIQGADTYPLLVEVYSMLGEKLHEQLVHEQAGLHLQHLPANLYMIVIQQQAFLIRKD